MSVLLVVAWALVGVGVYSGRRAVGSGVPLALVAALVWPVLVLVGVGRAIA